MSNQEIQNLLTEIEQLTQSELPLSEFYREVLGRITPPLGSAGTAVWTCGGDSVDLLCQNGPNGNWLGDEQTNNEDHRNLLANVRQSGQPCMGQPESVGLTQANGQSQNFMLGICPVKVGGDVVALVESIQPVNGQPDHQQFIMRLLSVFANAAAAFHQASDTRWQRKLESLSYSIHDSLHPIKTAFTIANDGRAVIGCDRLSVIFRRGRKCRIEAISGLETVHRRANEVRLLEKVANKVLAAGESLVYPNPAVELPPQLEEAVQEYIDVSQAKSLTLLPLTGPANKSEEPEESHRPPEIIGALVAEQFSGNPFSNDRIEDVGHHASSALRNAMEHHRVFLLPLWAAIGKMSWLVRVRTLPWTIVVSTLVLAAVLWATFWPADFKLTAEGTLQPEIRGSVFAKTDGTINQLLVSHGSSVARDEIVATLMNSAIEQQLLEITGKISNTIKRLDNIGITLIGLRFASTEADKRYKDQLSAEETELENELKSLAAQQKVIEAQIQDLNVLSPIEGEVITWNVEDLLTARPVSRGQTLMTVADLDGPWVLELLLPDRRLGHLHTAQDKISEDLEVSFIVATDPGTTLKGTILKVAKSTQIDKEDGMSVLVTVEINEGDIPNLRPGAEVVGKIHCGRRSIGYVWLHDLFEFVESRVLFRFFG